ncbi:hypothetical protein L1887_26832 [Cichorium endivia]|nr:hypothetical protein L1887_26832 [Cichorium endivia]
MEYTDEWSPFCTCPAPFSVWNKPMSSIESDKDINLDNGIPHNSHNDTNADCELEDGEYRPENNNMEVSSPEVEKETTPEPLSELEKDIITSATLETTNVPINDGDCHECTSLPDLELDDTIEVGKKIFSGLWYCKQTILGQAKVSQKCNKNWWNEQYKKENQEINAIKSRISVIETTAESRALSDNELQERNVGVEKVTEYERRSTLDLKQKARIRWTIDGDENSKFFHGYINNKARKNHINGLNINDRWTTNVAEIKHEAYNFFSEKFKEK